MAAGATQRPKFGLSEPLSKSMGGFKASEGEKGMCIFSTSSRCIFHYDFHVFFQILVIFTVAEIFGFSYFYGGRNFGFRFFATCPKLLSSCWQAPARPGPSQARPQPGPAQPGQAPARSTQPGQAPARPRPQPGQVPARPVPLPGHAPARPCPSQAQPQPDPSQARTQPGPARSTQVFA